jgi:hypothetical protein
MSTGKMSVKDSAIPWHGRQQRGGGAKEAEYKPFMSSIGLPGSYHLSAFLLTYLPASPPRHLLYYTPSQDSVSGLRLRLP